MGRWLIVFGLLLVAIGLVLHFAPWLLGWFGRLPGDIHVQSGRTRIFIPITTMILVSLLLTIVFNLLRR
jgi:hypothetical protein